MPRPPLLPTIDWRATFAQGQSYGDWLAQAEHADNARQMEKLRQELVLGPHERAWLGALARPVHVIAIAEDWCGDVVRHVPVLAALADQAPMLRVRFITREQFPEVFVRFLTNGGEAIPKFIFLNDLFVECGNWGPMPDNCRELIARGKACGEMGTARQRVSALYQADVSLREVVHELLHRIEVAATVAL